MDNLKILEELLNYPHETEWIEFKTSFWKPAEIGEYISAISNSAAMQGKKNGYFVWGIDDSTHQIVGTKVNYREDVNHEPFEHYIARNLNPSISFSFNEVYVGSKRVVILEIPAAKNVPTEFMRERYIRIGSSKENVRKYPQREARLWSVLSKGLPSLTNTDSERQELTFGKLFLYYGSKNKKIEKSTFKQNLHLVNESTGRYNLLALLMADDNSISVRVSIFNGIKKSDGLRSVKEFGNTCILYALQAVTNYGIDVLNIPITDETNRKLERNEIFLFDNDAFREAIINSFVHNNWLYLNAPQISVFSDRIEILSHGILGPDQTYEGFFKGESKPVNPSLAHILMQLEISDRSGKGVPTIVEKYGKNSYIFGEDSITLVIPFRNSSMVSDKDRILNEMRANNKITSTKLSSNLAISIAMVNKHIREMKQNGKIERVGSNRNGYWKIKDGN